MAFCREAPSEFNDHQRDVFCVFSGNGVTKLRTYLREQTAARHAAHPASPNDVLHGDVGIEFDSDAHHPDSDGSNTPTINVNVHSNYADGATPIIAGPTPPVPFPHGGHFQHTAPHASHALLSQSAPATTGGAMWAGGATPVMNHGIGAQHVTGMMGATILDDHDVDGDDVFGDGSEFID